MNKWYQKLLDSLPQDEQVKEDNLSGFNIKFEGGIKSYVSKDKTLKVWSENSCLERLEKLLKSDSSETQSDFFLKLANWIEEQPDKMHKMWANDCFEAMDKAADKLAEAAQAKLQERSQATVDLFDDSGINLFE